MRLTYILFDFENVKPTAADFKLIRGADYRVLLFHGPHQNKFDADIVKALQPLGAQVDYEKGERAGKNAGARDGCQHQATAVRPSPSTGPGRATGRAACAMASSRTSNVTSFSTRLYRR